MPDYGVTLTIMTNTDSDRAMVVVDALLEVLVDHMGVNDETVSTLPAEPRKQPSTGAEVIDTFQKENLFCEHNPQWIRTAGQDAWINISLDWVVGADADKAENAWKYYTHTITINGAETPDIEQYEHDVISYTVTCPDETLMIWVKGLSVYLPPLPSGEYEIKWYSQITGRFDNGWVTYEPGNSMEMMVQLTVE